jgi:hypothetical protein
MNTQIHRFAQSTQIWVLVDDQWRQLLRVNFGVGQLFTTAAEAESLITHTLLWLERHADDVP